MLLNDSDVKTVLNQAADVMLREEERRCCLMYLYRLTKQAARRTGTDECDIAEAVYRLFEAGYKTEAAFNALTAVWGCCKPKEQPPAN